jgi:hypothetical protein
MGRLSMFYDRLIYFLKTFLITLPLSHYGSNRFRVTRFSKNVKMFMYFWAGFENYNSKSYEYIIFDKNGFVNILGYFFTNSSGHPE